METTFYRYLFPSLLAVVMTLSLATSFAGTEHLDRHTTVSGVVEKGSGALVQKTAQGATHQLNGNISRRHGHEPFKVGDEVTAVIDENNYVFDMHPKGHEAKHRLVTGKLIHVGKMKTEIKLTTPDGEKVFQLADQWFKTKGINEGTPVIVELNEVGTVIDLHRAQPGAQ
jgi:hypothetical protein